jgi:hypothetical protein
MYLVAHLFAGGGIVLCIALEWVALAIHRDGEHDGRVTGLFSSLLLVLDSDWSGHPAMDHNQMTHSSGGF